MDKENTESNQLQPQDSPNPGVVKQNLKDAGNRSSNHYKKRLSPLRFFLRQKCLPLVRSETAVLEKIQQRYRNRALDIYFAWTANLASHTFYVLMLPLPLWFGASRMARDLIFVLGMGIYVTGFCKDFLCLPRPRSPPLHRITMSSYTAQEYGWPSSHSANATAVTLVLTAKLWELRSDLGFALWSALMVLLAVYYFSLIAGRLYCGMHGFLDVGTGALIGSAMFIFRLLFGTAVDQWVFASPRNGSWWGIFATAWMIILGHLALIHVYPEPVDDCPCFDDSVAFVGVLIGLDLSHYACVLSNRFAATNAFFDPIRVPFDTSRGPINCLMRFILGVALVVVWKSVSKPVLFTILPPIYKLVGVYLPRSHFISTARTKKTSRQIRSQSLSNMKNEPMLELDNVLKSVVANGKTQVGPTDDIDAYELLDYQSKHPDEKYENVKISGVFRKRYDVEIIGRVIVYAGISITSVWGFALASDALGL